MTAADASDAPDRLLLDEMLPPKVAELLAARGIDAVSAAADSTLRGQSDLVAMYAALSERRVLVTTNIVDFESLRRARSGFGEPMPGLIYRSSTSIPRARNFIGAISDALERAARDHSAQRCGGVFWLT
jgi:hypothetical protein